MGIIRSPLPVKPIVPMLSAHPALFLAAEDELVRTLGPLDYRSPLIAFAHTRYYEAELGAGLQRQFLSFAQLIDPGQLAGIKVLTNELETRLGAGGRRRINLDPGYVSEAKVVLATTKDNAHRLYIGQGIYAEVTLVYRDGDLRPWPWTYPDYQSEPYLVELHAIRRLYAVQLRALRQEGKAILRSG